MTEIGDLSATELAGLIRDGQLSPRAVVESFLARIGALNEELNLFCFVYGEEAIARARTAELAVTRGEPLGPLHGVPFAIKDFTPTKGKITTFGSKAFRNHVPEEDAPVVERLLAAGGILIGKTATPEFAHSGFTHSPLWGVSRNPWDPSKTPGGSSGGSGGAVAAGMVPLAEGSDAGGSIRIPAALCGVVGLKPSLGRVPMHITANDFEQIFHIGPIARTVADAALMLSVMQGPDERDPMSLSQTAEIPDDLSGGVNGYRIALSIDLGYYEVDARVEANTRLAADAFRSLGATVEEVELGWSDAINRAWSAYWGVLLAALYGNELDERRDDLDPEVVARMERGRAMSAVALKRIEQLRSRQWEALRPVLEAHDALMCPTTSVAAPPAEGTDSAYPRLDLCCPFNFVSQCPVISVPSGFTPEGLPTGVQIVGRRFDDVTVLRLAAALESAAPWAHRRPPPPRSSQHSPQ